MSKESKDDLLNQYEGQKQNYLEKLEVIGKDDQRIKVMEARALFKRAEKAKEGGDIDKAGLLMSKASQVISEV